MDLGSLNIFHCLYDRIGNKYSRCWNTYVQFHASISQLDLPCKTGVRKPARPPARYYRRGEVNLTAFSYLRYKSLGTIKIQKSSNPIESCATGGGKFYNGVASERQASKEPKDTRILHDDANGTIEVEAVLIQSVYLQ